MIRKAFAEKDAKIKELEAAHEKTLKELNDLKDAGRLTTP